MKKPLVAVIGRPNVGKSSLFNRVIGRRTAVVDDMPGVTRDRLYADVETGDVAFSLVDTGGLVPDANDPVIEQVRSQVSVAAAEASLIWFVADVIDGLAPDDAAIADMLRKLGRPVVLAANKADNPRLEMNAHEFHELGFETVVPVSSIHGRGIHELLDRTAERLQELPLEEENGAEQPNRPLRIAVVGRPNAGKSSIVNAALGEDRVIVDSAPGTTRDAVNAVFEWQGSLFELIDTAGIRRKARIEAKSVEQHSVLRATRSVERSDVTWLTLDVTREASHQDKTIMGFVARRGKLCILVANKWDLIEKDNDTYGEYAYRLRRAFRAFDHLPIVFTSATTGQRIETLLELSLQLYSAGSAQLSTPFLNDWLSRVVMERPPRMTNNRRPALKYITQAGVLPPTFLVFCTYPKLIQPSYARYLTNRLREEGGFEGAPIRFEFRNSRPNRGRRLPRRR